MAAQLGVAGAQEFAVEPPALGEAPREASTVYFCMDPRSLQGGFYADRAVVRAMVDALVMAATGTGSPRAGWRSLVSPTDVVGIKVSAAPGDIGGTKPAVAEAVALGLQEAGISPKNIVVWDRNEEDLILAGYRKDSPHYSLAWVDPSSGYDPESILTAPVLGRLIWGDSRFGRREDMRLEDLLSSGEQLSSTSHYASVLSKTVTKVINLPSLADSFLSGVNGAIANMTLWNVDNWRRFVKRPHHGDPYLAEIYADPMVYDKVVLTIMDGLVIQFAGGPLPNPNFARENFTLFASVDPVAIDATALRLLEEYRIAARLPSLIPKSGHISSAEALGIGNASEDAIRRVRVGVGEIR